MEWIKTKEELPPLGMVVECIGPKDWIYSKLGRDYFALVKVNKELIWISPSLTDYSEEEKLNIKYWRYLKCDPSGKTPHIKIKKYKVGTGYVWEPKVIFKKFKNRDKFDITTTSMLPPPILQSFF